MLKSQTKGETPDGIGEMPVLVTINGIPVWQASGRTFPLVAGAEDPPPADDHTEDDEDTGGDFDKDRALATIRKQRERERAKDAELKAARTRLAALEAKDKERADADKSELEKAQARLAEREKAHAEAEAKLKRLQISQAIERAARKFNARNPEVVAKLIDQGDLEFDDAGEPTNADKLVKDLLQAEKYLVADGRSETTNGVPSTPRSNGQPSHDDRVKQAKDKLVATGDYQPL